MEAPVRLSVKEVADIAGVTPRTVRYYHSIGLLPEPPRDNSGYRRYGGKDVVELVRVARLRGLGMSLPQIAERVGTTEVDDASLSQALDSLADEIDAEIDRLAATRDRLRALARSETFDQPVRALTQALQSRGVLGPADQLGDRERWAAAVLDALHPEGMPGMLTEASGLFGDSGVVAALRPLRRRLARLGPRSTDEEIDELVGEVAAILASGDVNGHVDLGLVDLLLRERLNPAQQRFMRRLRTRLQDAG